MKAFKRIPGEGKGCCTECWKGAWDLEPVGSSSSQWAQQPEALASFTRVTEGQHTHAAVLTGALKLLSYYVKRHSLVL